jgi:iron complex transport system substrate-binding protein
VNLGMLRMRLNCRQTLSGGIATLELIVQLKPDLIVDVGSMTDTYISLADRVQSQTGS